MIDIENEELISLAEAAGMVPSGRKGRSPDVKTVYLWTTAGCRGVVLETVQIAGRRGTSKEAVRRFLQELTAASNTGKQPRRARPNEARNQAAEAELDRLGVDLKRPAGNGGAR